MPRREHARALCFSALASGPALSVSGVTSSSSFSSSTSAINSRILAGVIVIVQDGPLGALVDQLTVNRLETAGRALNDFPLCGCGQRNAHAGLQTFEAIEGKTLLHT